MMPLLYAALLAALPIVQQPRIVGDTRYKPYQLVRLRVENVPAKAAIVWRVSPGPVDRATTSRDILQFVAPPGTYTVEALIIRTTQDSVAVDELFEKVVIEQPGQPPVPPVPPKPDPSEKPLNAINRIRFGNAGCTANIVAPKRIDGRWDVVTAAHCVSNVGQRGLMYMRDGRALVLRVVYVNKTADVAWCVTEEPHETLPAVELASGNPAIGTKVWHGGFGVDKPGNIEFGEVAGNEDRNGQIRFVLSVSSGDSGGGIYEDATNKLLSVVCCTTGMAQKVSMYGCSTRMLLATRPTQDAVNEALKYQDTVDPLVDEINWKPLPIPIVDKGRNTNGN